MNYYFYISWALTIIFTIIIVSSLIIEIYCKRLNKKMNWTETSFQDSLPERFERVHIYIAPTKYITIGYIDKDFWIYDEMYTAEPKKIPVSNHHHITHWSPLPMNPKFHFSSICHCELNVVR